MLAAPPSSVGETMLVELTQWLARAMQYSLDHPACARLGEMVCFSLERALERSSPLSFGVLKDGITLEDDVFAAHPSVRQRLAPHLHERGVLVVRFLPGVTVADLAKLVEALLLPVQTIFDRGGVAGIVAERGVTHVEIEQLEHDISVEERGAQVLRKELRAFLASTLKSLRAERALGADVGTQLRQLLDDPELTVALLEDDPLGVCEGVAALCLMVREERERSGTELFPKLRRILVTLSPASHDRVLLGFPTLVGDFRDALGWALRLLSMDDRASMSFPSFRRHANELDVVFYALSAAFPRDGDRNALMRRVALFLYDLPEDDPAASELIAVAARSVDDFDSYRRERECLAPHALAVVARRSSFSRRPPSIPPSADTALRVIDGRRATFEVVRMASRTRRFDRLCSRLPESSALLADANAMDAVIGIVHGLDAVVRNEWRELAVRTLAQVCSLSLVSRLLAHLEVIASSSEGTELEEVIATIRILVVQHPAAVLEHLGTCENRKIRRILLDALPRAGATVLPLVRAKLCSESWFVVRNAIALLPRVGGTAGDLARVVRHPNEKVRMELVRALHLLPADASSAEIAAMCLEDPAEDVRLRVRGLVRGELIGPAGILALERVGADEAQPEATRRVAVEALGRCPHDDAAAALFRLLQPRGLIERGSIRELAAVALRSSPAPNAPALFEEGLSSSVLRVRKACQRAAGGG